jgi:cyclohexanecarboxylate-CoA ligase
MSSPIEVPSTLWELVELRAAATPTASMLIDGRERSLSFREFRDAAESTAAALMRHGVGEGSRVSWQLPTTLEAFVTMAALARLGAVQNPIVPILRRREVSFIVDQTGCELLIAPTVFRGFDHGALARAVADETGCAVLLLDDGHAGPHGLSLPAGDPSTLPMFVRPAGAPDAPGPTRWIFYTSGTTAEPKGVRHVDRSAMASARSYLTTGWFDADDVLVVPIPAAHIAGIMILTAQLAVGFALVLVEAFDPVATPALAARHDATVIIGNVAVFNAYIAAQRAHGTAALLPRFKVAPNGGAPRSPELHEAVRRELGGLGTMSSWGLTECPSITCCRPDDPNDLLARTEGPAVVGVDLHVVDATGAACPPGVEGELRVRGPQLFQGYVDTTLDADAFDERGLFHTGDMGVMEPTGHVRITGRIKDIIIRNAENISALEVENALSSHPGVADVAVIGVPDATTGERCCAVVAPAPGEPVLTLAEIARHCREMGMATQKIPEQLELVEAIPRNDLGKIQKQAMRAMFAPPASP